MYEEMVLEQGAWEVCATTGAKKIAKGDGSFMREVNKINLLGMWNTRYVKVHSKKS